jgi:ferredoxin
MTTILGEDKRYEHDRKTRKKYKLRIVYNKNGCIASGHCILSDPYNFKLDSEFKADLVDGAPHPTAKGTWVKEIETDEPHLVINAAKTCTPRVIAVIDLETGQRIAP